MFMLRPPLFAVLLLAIVAPDATAAKAARPNILFIFSDDLTCQAISAYGEKRHLLDTPNMDRIAREGMRFDRCLVTNSICGPSRATILTGKYSHLNGFYNNSTSRFDSAQQTFPKLLQSVGYTTALIGKWHLVSDPTGFDHWHILPGQGVYYNPPMIKNGKPIKHTGYTTDIITDLTVDWLKNRDKTKPFLLMCQHKAPHREWAPALRHLGWDNNRKHPEPETLFDDYAGRSKAISDHDMGLDRTFNDVDAKFVPPANMNDEQLNAWNAYYQPRNKEFRQANLTGKDLVRWRYNRYMHDYLGCVKAVDESVGRLLNFLEEEGLAENTLIVFSSDQGFFLGEHGWFDKRWIFEESLRTPLLVRWPGVTKPGGENGNLVSLLDFAETFLDIAGAAIPADMQGRSLVPLLKGETPTDWRKSLYYHYYEFPEPHRVRPHYGVVTDRFKLVHYYKPDVDDWELLDRKKDPLEVKNFYDEPAYAETVKELHAELDRVRNEVQDVGETPRSAYGSLPFDNERKPVSQSDNEKKHGHAPVNGLKMYYEIHGDAHGDTPPLVLLHGGGSTIETTFGNVLPSLAKSRQVIAFEQQGHGRTADIADRPFTFEQSADDTVALLEHLKIEKADLFGFSNGGNIALQIAIRHPGHVRKLVVASGMFKREGLYPQVWEFMKRSTLQDMPQALQDTYRNLSPHPDQLQSFHDKSAKRMLDFKDWRSKDIQSIQAPTLLIIGDADSVRPEHAVEMFRLLPHANLAILPGGHGAYIDEVTAARVEGSQVHFDDRRSSSKTQSKLPELVVGMIEEFLDAPMPEPKKPESIKN